MTQGLAVLGGTCISRASWSERRNAPLAFDDARWLRQLWLLPPISAVALAPATMREELQSLTFATLLLTDDDECVIPIHLTSAGTSEPQRSTMPPTRQWFGIGDADKSRPLLPQPCDGKTLEQVIPTCMQEACEGRLQGGNTLEINARTVFELEGV